MKPLLRAVLVINALIFLGAGLLFLLTPWASLYGALQLEPVQPAFVGQLFGIALIGLSWIAFHAAVDGALTATAAKVCGHVEWLSGLVMLVWLLGLRTPQISGFGQVVAALVGVALLILGLGSVRLSGAVRRRERAALAGAVSASRAEKRAAKREVANEAANERPEWVEPVVTSAPVAASVGEPVVVATRRATIDPLTGREVAQPIDPVIDPATGRRVEPVGSATSLRPAAGRPDPLRPEVGHPEAGRPDPLL
jgi:hypothetical protein